MREQQTLRTAGLLSIAAAAVMGGSWFGIPGPWLLLLAAIHVPVLLFQRRAVPALLAVDLGFAARGAYFASPMYFSTNFDTWMHLSMIRRVVEHGPVPPDPYYVGYSAAPVLSLIHQLHGAVVWLTGFPIGEVWIWGIPFLTIAIGGIAFFFHRELLGDPIGALFATLFFVAFRYMEWPHANYPRAAAPAFYLLALGLLLRGLRRRSHWGCAAAGLALGLSIGTHPVSGATGAMVAAVFLLLEWVAATRAGSGRPLVRCAAAFVGGAVVAASPWIALDLLALAQVDALPPIISAPKQDLAYHLTVEVGRILQSGREIGDFRLNWLVLWGPPLALGLTRCFIDDTPRFLRTYVAASLGVVAIVLATPLAAALSELVSSRYVARVVVALPIPALAGFGLAWIARSARSAPDRAVAAIVLALYVALPLRSIELLQLQTPTVPPVIPDRPEFSMLERRFDQKTVLATAKDSYTLPYYTGAFVVWNPMGHSNPYAWDPERVSGARSIFDDAAAPEEIARYAEEFEVDFALVRKVERKTIAMLVESGVFERRESVPGFVVLERVAPSR